VPGHFFFEKTFTAGGTKKTALEEKLELVSGVVHNVVLDFPAGCLYLCNVRIMRASFSVWPRNQGAYYKYEDFQLEIKDSWILPDGQKHLTLQGYNLDDTEDHTISVALQVSDTELYFAQLGLLDKMETFIAQQKAIIGV